MLYTRNYAIIIILKSEQVQDLLVSAGLRPKKGPPPTVIFTLSQLTAT